MHISLTDGWADVSYSLLFQASLERDVVVMPLDTQVGCYDLELFFPPLMLSCFFLFGRTSCHPGDSLALLCFSKWFTKEGRHFYTRPAIASLFCELQERLKENMSCGCKDFFSYQ